MRLQSPAWPDTPGAHTPGGDERRTLIYSVLSVSDVQEFPPPPFFFKTNTEHLLHSLCCLKGWWILLVLKELNI